MKKNILFYKQPVLSHFILPYKQTTPRVYIYCQSVVYRYSTVLTLQIRETENTAQDTYTISQTHRQVISYFDMEKQMMSFTD